MQKGTVKFFNHEKSYGFIIAEDNTQIFVHKSGVEFGKLQEGDQVTYELENGKKGVNAVNVRKQ
jgi:CspA family cold shock protein